MPARLLVVEDIKVQALHLRRLLEKEGHEVTVCADAEEATALLAGRDFDLVFADLNLAADEDGLALFSRVRAQLGDEAPPFVILTAYGTAQLARRAIKAGVDDFLSKPVHATELEACIKNALEHQRLRRENRALSQAVRSRQVAERLIGNSRPFLAMLELARAAAGSEATILIRGESGTGKELVADFVHAASPRAGGPLVKVNCGAIPAPLLEAELFGHERGAFTDASEARLGRFELAQGGTLFLDEIGDLPLPLQVKLLRVVQARAVERLGGQGEVIPLDVRLVAATHHDLEAMVRKGTFREDLYYRINVITIQAPPLRERRGDLELLAEAFRLRFNERDKRAFKGFSPEALEALRRHDWPGNVRELENAVERAVALGRGERLELEHLPPAVRQGAARPRGGDLAARLLDTGLGLEDVERLLITRALEAAGGNVSRAARQLGLTRRTLQYRMGRDEGARAART